MFDAEKYSKRFKEKAYTTQGVYSQPGNLPLIITAPHGGLSKPETIPDRTRDGSLLLADMHTKEIALGIGEFVSDHYRSAPHVISNDISRRKADVNRPLQDGAETDAGERVWREYHQSVQFSVEKVLKSNRSGLLVDIHGHTHFDGAIELGYLLSLEELQSKSVILDQIILEKSSIRQFAKRHGKTTPHKLLYYFGDLIAASSENHIAVSPSSHMPIPLDKNYFVGGFTTQYYHNLWNGLDVIQVEIPRHLRLHEKNRRLVIKVVSLAIINMLDRYYIKHGIARNLFSGQAKLKEGNEMKVEVKATSIGTSGCRVASSTRQHCVGSSRSLKKLLKP
ncbi:hypothetical protein [Parasitella parasitica]|uniref:N-formylglutamate amidohydrolase n=1 Tax=Parasitella parasitica TaxID=35722 RepID=A0A0B7NU30_9FUNG|nr:hypothetical protein [Parasitella parasitica]